jgi:DHA3 family macrolide efflux protein-like MFS transporter
VQFALVWYLTTSTGSATVLAFASLMTMLPQSFLGPVVGALVDRWNRRIVMMAADSLIALATIGLAVAGPLSDAVGVRPWFVVGGLVTTAMGVGAFFVPAIMRVEDKASLEDNS